MDSRQISGTQVIYFLRQLPTDQAARLRRRPFEKNGTLPIVPVEQFCSTDLDIQAAFFFA
jgi:hypothetical protein